MSTQLTFYFSQLPCNFPSEESASEACTYQNFQAPSTSFTLLTYSPSNHLLQLDICHIVGKAGVLCIVCWEDNTACVGVANCEAFCAVDHNAIIVNVYWSGMEINSDKYSKCESKQGTQCLVHLLYLSEIYSFISEINQTYHLTHVPLIFSKVSVWKEANAEELYVYLVPYTCLLCMKKYKVTVILTPCTFGAH